MKVIDELLRIIRSSSAYNSEVQVAPHCILWPDHERQWESSLPKIKSLLPELFVLGKYNPQDRKGPAIWLRCVISNSIEGINIPKGTIPIIYLPGVSRQDLRAVDTCPDNIKPLAELQYRGIIWSQVNAKDWTILAFLMSNQGGLSLDVAQDRATQSAMLIALDRLLEEDVNSLRWKRLDKEFFNTLLTSGDPVRDLLLLLDQGAEYKTRLEQKEWNAFVDILKSQFTFDPLNDGELMGIERLATREGPWELVWERFCEAPTRYPNIPSKIRKTIPTDLFIDQSAWPQWNDSEEEELRNELLKLNELPPHKARTRIKDLNEKHKKRRGLVWAELGQSPLAMSIEWLAILAEITDISLAAGTINDIVSRYIEKGWEADDAVLKALATVNKQLDVEAVIIAVRSVYFSWIEDLSRYFQKLVKEHGYPVIYSDKSANDEPQCIVFVDGLRYDVAKRLIENMTKYDVNVTDDFRWAALPSITATGKPAVTPVRHLITGRNLDSDFEPSVASTNQSLKGGYHLRKLLKEEGWEILNRDESGTPTNKAWCEFGDIDNEGHNRGWKLSHHLDTILNEIEEKIIQLLNNGWSKIQIVTDHGWLLMPGGLPKLDLPSSLAENKWGRFAVIKEGARTQEELYPWYWNPNYYFALANGISCYRSGQEYTHGGLSIQECLTPQITIIQKSTKINNEGIEFTDIVWRGLRCNVAVVGEFDELTLDIRLRAGNSSTSIVLSTKKLNTNGVASVVIEDEDLEGREAFIVLVNESGQLIAQTSTIIGGGD
ncbi:BREX-1 system phosphatase PglZ type B [Neobacillus niacini]|uniref:BREX-1 system phosphatase PglZ type B n=1 Tax=Neobacillus niacini TaxID=86668 RepID=UPI001C8D2D29|nr:BREX-1 system phosphatase PglZ type B [Neobacillus niacini]MBY0147755.1 BREX-1 system phosphatase PglZ type B [Neobacillus niacini]